MGIGSSRGGGSRQYTGRENLEQFRTQSNQRAGLVSFLIFCSISIFLLVSPVAGRRPQYTAGAD
jgi:hypothetical protein